MISRLPSITKASVAIRQGTLSASELVEFCLDRIRRLDSQIRAWVSVDEVGARREAAHLTELARGGKILGPLHGIPVGIKDIVDVAGWPTKCGSPLRENRVATSDAKIVQRLRNAGAIIFGKTVTTEFACFDPPPTRNPWNLNRTPGGSSSGSAAAVALEMCLAAVGTQTGGSIIRPASYCGVVGLKPTFGAVSLDGIEPLSWNLDHAGPITRCVEDAATMFQVMSHQPLTPPKAEPPTVMRLSSFFDERSDKEVLRVFSAAVERLNAASIKIESSKNDPVNFADMLSSHRRLITVGAAAHHRAAFQNSREQFGPRIRELIEEGRQTAAVDYASALRHQMQVQAELTTLLQGHVWIMPSTTSAAPGQETTGDPAFNSLWSFAGLPEITIPCGLTSDGLPCGIQLVGAANSETELFSIAAACEKVLHFDEEPKIRKTDF